jgi:hypothetical protein
LLDAVVFEFRHLLHQAGVVAVVANAQNVVSESDLVAESVPRPVIPAGADMPVEVKVQ